jgi:hypothetical protein
MKALLAQSVIYVRIQSDFRRLAPKGDKIGTMHNK